MDNYKYFKNEKCEYYPCHKEDDGYFNCLFCFCPLYTLGDKCGGNPCYTPSGVKDCSCCTKVHRKEGYDFVIKKLSEK